MRLTAAEQKEIRKAILKLDPKAKIFLYGSRTRDDLKGGDIDLLVISESLNFKSKIDILVELNLALGDQKIDLLLKNPKDLSSDPFILSVLEKALEVK